MSGSCRLWLLPGFDEHFTERCQLPKVPLAARVLSLSGTTPNYHLLHHFPGLNYTPTRVPLLSDRCESFQAGFVVIRSAVFSSGIAKLHRHTVWPLSDWKHAWAVTCCR